MSSHTLSLIGTYSYVGIFILMLIEGPIVTSAAAFAASFGFLNIYIIFILSVLGDIVADIIYYYIGKFARVAFVERFITRFKFGKKKLEKLEKQFQDRKIRTIIAIKLTPLIPGPGLMLAGALNVSFLTLLWLTLAITVPKSLLFLIIGYVFGTAYVKFSSYYNYAFFIIAAGVLVVWLTYYLYKRFSKSISDKMQ